MAVSGDVVVVVVVAVVVFEPLKNHFPGIIKIRDSTEGVKAAKAMKKIEKQRIDLFILELCQSKCEFEDVTWLLISLSLSKESVFWFCFRE